MGVLRSSVSFEAEVEELRKVLRIDHLHKGRRRLQKEQKQHGHGYDINENRRVCVTSGISFLGFAIVNRLLTCGYNVRLLLDTQEDLEKVREMEMIDHIHEEEEADDDDDDDERRRRNGGSVGAVVVGDMMDVNSLCEAFNGCSCVFHTSAFTNSTGVSGYSKHMAEIEARSAERVIEACVRTQSVRKCVFTSSLLACIWRGDYSPHNHRLPTIVDENCWSDETLCRDRKLWFALGKTMAEKAAWRAARGRDLRLVTLCPGLVTGPGFRRRNSTPSIAYLKGAQEMLTDGLLATVDISKLAEAHVGIYEAMGTASAAAACGRYICFGHVIRRVEEVTELERQLGITPSRISANVAADAGESPPTNWFELSNRKLSRLMSPTNRRCSYDIYSILYT